MVKLTATTLAILAAAPALAEQTVTATVDDHYSYYVERVPEVKRVCETIQVPIYETREKGATAGDVLSGALIGGLLGGTASGKDEGAALGAFIGGVIAGESKKKETVVTGYKEELNCNTIETYREVERQEYDHSVLTFTLDGAIYSVPFKK
jgi:uncharacterized protein YcfJ